VYTGAGPVDIFAFVAFTGPAGQAADRPIRVSRKLTVGPCLRILSGSFPGPGHVVVSGL